MTVYANELIGQSRRFAKGFINNKETLALKEINKLDVGGNFITTLNDELIH